MQEEEQKINSRADSFLLAVVGALVALIGGFALFAATYQPLTGLGNTPVWKISLMDGVIISAVGALAFVFRKKTAFLQGILISAALLFILNGFCGLGGY